MNKLAVAIIAVAMLLTGCSSNDSTTLKKITKNDMCITHINSDAKICYGDERVKVEKIVGLTIDPEPYLSVAYINGLSMMYRDDKVVGIDLEEESVGTYETVIGAKIGGTKKQLKELYKDAIAIELGTRNLDYFYYTEKNIFLDETNYTSSANQGEADKIYIVSFMFDEDGLTERIMLIDGRMAIYLS